jgi:hypothetical protein
VEPGGGDEREEVTGGLGVVEQRHLI